MAKKTKTKEKSTKSQQPQPAKIEQNKAPNHTVLLGLLLVGVGILLFMLFQAQTTISDQRAKIAEQQQEITKLEERVEELEKKTDIQEALKEAGQTIIEGRTDELLENAEQLILEQGEELLRELINPNQPL